MQTNTASSFGGDEGMGDEECLSAQVGQSFHYSPEVLSRKHDHHVAEN